jgi:predicted small secreted protein
MLPVGRDILVEEAVGPFHQLLQLLQETAQGVAVLFDLSIMRGPELAACSNFQAQGSGRAIRQTGNQLSGVAEDVLSDMDWETLGGRVHVGSSTLSFCRLLPADDEGVAK